MTNTIYEIIQNGETVIDGYDSKAVIAAAIEHYEEQAEECGEWEETVILREHNEDTGTETDTEITLSLMAQNDNYDHGRTDYYASRA